MNEVKKLLRVIHIMLLIDPRLHDNLKKLNLAMKAQKGGREKSHKQQI